VTIDPLLAEALGRLRGLFDEAHSRGLDEPWTAALATADLEARPSVRTITIAAIDDEGPLFFVDGRSGKGRQLAANPHAALCFFWPGLHYQVIVEGDAIRIDDERADHYWNRRPRDSQIAAWASEMEPAEDSEPEADNGVTSARQRFAWDAAPRPPHWHATRVAPTSLSFWKTGWRRLDAREHYARDDAGRWHKERRRPLGGT